MKKKAIILFSICLVVLIGAIIADRVMSKSYFKELKYMEVIEKVKNKDSFVLCVSQTSCSHCKSYKPKLEDVANDNKIYIYYIEVDLLNSEESKELKKYINYSGTPATVFIKDGYEETAATRINGDASKEKILYKLKSNGFVK